VSSSLRPPRRKTNGDLYSSGRDPSASALPAIRTSAKPPRPSANPARPGRFKSLLNSASASSPRFPQQAVFESLLKSGAMDPSLAGHACLREDAIIPSSVPPVPRSPAACLLLRGAAASPKFSSNCATLSWREEEPSSEYAMLGVLRSRPPARKYASRLLKDPRPVARRAEVHAPQNRRRRADRRPRPHALQGTGGPLPSHDSGHDRVAGTPRFPKASPRLANI